MERREQIKLKGYLTIRDMETNKIVVEKENVIFDSLLIRLSNALITTEASPSELIVGAMAFGDGGGTASGSDTGLANETLRKRLESIAGADRKIKLFSCNLLAAELSGVVREIGLVRDVSVKQSGTTTDIIESSDGTVMSKISGLNNSVGTKSYILDYSITVT